MFLIDGDDLFEIDESECTEDADGSGVWVDSEDGSGDELFYEYCELDENDYDLS